MGGAMTDQEFRAAVLQRLDNLASQIGEVHVEIGAVKDRLTAVEGTVNQIAFNTGIVPGRHQKTRAHA